MPVAKGPHDETREPVVTNSENPGLDVNEQMAGHVLVVALMKSGTHLIQELLIALGYRIAGVPRIPEAFRARLRTRNDVARLAAFQESGPDPSHMAAASDTDFHEFADEVWHRAHNQIQRQLGAPLDRHYGRCTASTGFTEARYLPISETPAPVAWIQSELAIDRVDGGFWREWTETGRPAVIFLHRDPRATTLSMVRFLLNATGKGFGDYQDFAVFHEILASIDTLENQLEYALTDPSFPGRNDHMRMAWLLRHPRVLAVSYDELVGPEGGGSAARQLRAVRSICEHLMIDPAEAEKVAGGIYNTGSFTFHQGMVDSWRKHYSTAVLNRANDTFRRELTAYGYVQ